MFKNFKRVGKQKKNKPYRFFEHESLLSRNPPTFLKARASRLRPRQSVHHWNREDSWFMLWGASILCSPYALTKMGGRSALKRGSSYVSLQEFGDFLFPTSGDPIQITFPWLLVSSHGYVPRIICFRRKERGREEEKGGGGNTFEVKRASYWHRRMTEACRLPSAVLICQDPQISVSIKSCSFGFDKPSKFIVGCSKRYFFSVFGSCFSFSTVFLFILFPAFATEIG